MTTEAVKFAQNDVKCIFREPDWRVECRPFPSSKKSHFQSEARREAIDMETIFHYDANKTHFHNKGFARSLVLKVRFFGILFRSWYTLLTLHEVDIPFQSADQLTGLFDGSSTSRSTCFLELLSPRIWCR